MTIFKSPNIYISLVKLCHFNYYERTGVGVRFFYKCNFNRLAEKWLVLLALGWVAGKGVT